LQQVLGYAKPPGRGKDEKGHRTNCVLSISKNNLCRRILPY